MLVACPECSLKVSDKAVFCPHCGLPFSKQIKYQSNRHKKLPNGFGQITKLNQNLRKPYRAMVTVGTNEHGRPICKLLRPEAYFKTYNEAYAALVEYNKSPFDFEKDYTMQDLYTKWFAKYQTTVTKKTATNTALSWKYCSAIYNLHVRDLRAYHVKSCMEDSNIIVRGEVRRPSAKQSNAIKMLLSTLMDYAIELGVIEQNYVKAIKRVKENTNPDSHSAFSNDELNIFWQHKDERVAQFILIQCYMGWRPSELLAMPIENINFEEWTMTGGSKTEAGRDRVVPIAKKIRGIVLDASNNGTPWLFPSANETSVRYSVFIKEFKKFLQKYHIAGHKLHDGRKTFVTNAKAFGLNEYAIKRIVGHSITDTTENIYTERPISWLAEELEKM